MTDITMPPALEERRAELQRMIDDLQDQISTHEDGLAAARHDISVFAAEMRGINTAAEAYAWCASPTPTITLGDEAPRKPRRDFRAMVREEIERNGWQHHMDAINAGAVAQSLGCRVSQVEAALRAINEAG